MSELMLLFILIFPSVCSFVGYLIGIKSERYRNIFNIAVTGVNFVVVSLLFKPVSMQPVDISINHIMGTGLHLRLDVFRYIFLWITSLVWFLTTVYSTRYLIRYKNRNRYYLFFMLTLASTIGIFISENFLNLFTFFEIMSLTSYALIIHDEDDYAHDAGQTYIVMAVGGGMILLMGLFLLFNYTQTLDISELYTAVKDLGTVKYVISALIIVGFGVKAGMVPLHVWLPKAHPAAPAPASAVLSGILLKTGIFGIILTIEIMLKGDFYVSVIIMVIGFINMFIGGLLAMFQRNIKRILAYSSMSQVGYILVGIGLVGILKEHSAIAVYGTLFHIINHAIFKVLLFMGAGIIYMALHELSINKIGGFGIDKTPLKIFFLIGFLAIIGMPGFNGFVSKTLLHEALSEAHAMYHTNLFTAAEVAFTLSSSFTVAYLLKIFIAVFVERSDNNFDHVNYKPSKATVLPLGILSALIVFIGIKPDFILGILGDALKTFSGAHSVEIHVFSIESIKSSAITILLGCSIYLLFIRKVLRKGTGTSWYYINPVLNWFNLENNLYKPVGRVAFHICLILFKFIDEALTGTALCIGRAFEALGRLEVKYIRNMVHTIRNTVKNEFLITSESIKQFQDVKQNGIDSTIDSIKAFKDRKQNEIISSIDSIKEFQSTKQEEITSAIEDGINGIKQKEKTVYSIRDMIVNIVDKAGSVTYSIFIFAAVLVACLIYLIF